MRYVLGPSFAFTIPPPPPPPVGVDMAASIVSTDPTGVALSFTSPSQPVNVPSEVRVYLAAAGSSLPATADEWISSGHAYTSSAPSLSPDGGQVTIGYPSVPPGDYLGQVIIGYPD